MSERGAELDAAGCRPGRVDEQPGGSRHCEDYRIEGRDSGDGYAMAAWAARGAPERVKTQTRSRAALCRDTGGKPPVTAVTAAATVRHFVRHVTSEALPGWHPPSQHGRLLLGIFLNLNPDPSYGCLFLRLRAGSCWNLVLTCQSSSQSVRQI